MSILEIDGNADNLFEGFAIVTEGSTKIYMEGDLTTLTQADRSVTSVQSVEYFHLHNRSISTSYILLENQSKVDFLCNPNLLCNIRASHRTLHLRCNTGTIPVNQVGNLPRYGRVRYQLKGIANILRLSNVADNYKYWICSDSQENKNFIVTRIKDGK